MQPARLMLTFFTSKTYIVNPIVLATIVLLRISVAPPNGDWHADVQYVACHIFLPANCKAAEVLPLRR